MGVDTHLIEDGTYFVVECERRIAGCGGWSRRETLFGGDHSGGRDARLLDPATEPARVRAMYTHPDFARRGVGGLVLSLCDAAAARKGFRSLELPLHNNSPSHANLLVPAVSAYTNSISSPVTAQC
jgi:GNAT superfamily N-acetyltransferase